MKSTANCKIKEKINNSLIQTTGIKHSIDAEIANSKLNHHNWK